MLEPLTKLLYSKVKFKWTETEEKRFKEIQPILAHNILLAYTDFNKLSEIHTNASSLKLGTVIFYEGKLTAFYGRKTINLQIR